MSETAWHRDKLTQYRLWRRCYCW